MKVPSLSHINERLKAYLDAVPPNEEDVFYSEDKLDPFLASVKAYWLKEFNVDVKYDTMNSVTYFKMLEVVQKNFFIQVIYKKVVADLLIMNKKAVLSRVTLYRENQINQMILVVSLVVQFLQQGFINQAPPEKRQLLLEIMECGQESARYLSSYLGSDSYKASMEAHSASTEGEDLDRKALCTVLNNLAGLAMYTARASDDEIDRALGIPKRANTQGEASASGGGGKGMPQMPNAPDEGSASGGGSTDTSLKRSGPEGESSDSGKAPQKKAKVDEKRPAGTDENADGKSNEERLHGMCFDFFKSIYEDPDNVKQKWTFKTLDVLKSTADKCKKVPVRITYAIRIVDHFQRCEWVENGFAGDIVTEALCKIFSSNIEDTELESVMTQAIDLMQQRA
jgi:hypothetical protein